VVDYCVLMCLDAVHKYARRRPAVETQLTRRRTACREK